MSKALVLGNGKSRAWFRSPRWVAADDVVTWGCNAIYRDGHHCVDNLVAMDYAMQQEIYDSGWCDEDTDYLSAHNVYFANWNIVPSDVADAMFMGFDIPETYIHKTEKSGHHAEQCVIAGTDPATLHERLRPQ